MSNPSQHNPGDGRKPKGRNRTLILLVMAALGLLAGWYIMVTPGLKPVVISVYEPPIVKASERIHNLGVIDTDDRVHHTFLVYNLGGKHLRIKDIETSCGCTVADTTKKVIAPGDFSRLDVTMDTSIKLGRTRKKITLHTNDPEHPEYALFLTGNVVQRQLKKVHDGDNAMAASAKDPLVLFKGDCATCHTQRGLGKSGKALFLADCAMCHGQSAQGVKGITDSLLTPDFEDEKEFTRLRGVIADGSPNTPEMPPFGQKKGGPLNDAEIDSLMNFLKFNATQAKLGLLDHPEGDLQEADERAFQEALKESGLTEKDVFPASEK